MSHDRFPYDMPGRLALVRLINETFPHYKLKPKYTAFRAPFFSPTGQIPGRTFIEAEDTDKNKKMWFVFRRLDLGIAFPENVRIFVEGLITPRKIALELNRSYNMTFDATDVHFLDIPLVPLGQGCVYRMRALPGSYVWYGSAIIEIAPTGTSVDARLLEDGTYRLLEDGTIRLME